MKYNRLVDPQRIISLHIRLAYEELRESHGQIRYGFQVFMKPTIVSKYFPWFERLKEGIFIGPQIRKVVNDKSFEDKLTLKERSVWESFQLIVNGTV